MPSAAHVAPCPTWPAVMSDCTKCDQPHVTRFGKPSCTRHRADGSPCAGSPLKGTVLCQVHGRSPSVLARHHATVAAQAMGLDPKAVAANPLQALRAYTAETARQWARYHDEMETAMASLHDAVYVNKVGDERIKAAVVLYGQVCDRLEKSLEALAKLNIDERLTRLEEAKVAYVIDAIEAALEAAGFDASQRADARLAVGNELARGRPQLSRAAG